jgi:two-component system OmpR family response regulator
MTLTENGPKRALVIDDDPTIRELLATILETAGFEVDTFSDGIDALELKKPYDVILLDLRMPIFDAARLTDYWKLTDPDVLRRVILLTGYSRLLSDRDLGTFATIAKPFNHHDVLKEVDLCLRRDGGMMKATEGIKKGN